MKQEYEDMVRTVCGEDWNSQSKPQDERDGGFGVAMVAAYLKGTPSKLMDLAKEIEAPPYLLDFAYRRLQVNGLLSDRSWVLSDPYMVSTANPDRTLQLWCHVAALSSGFLGKGLSRSEYARFEKENESQ